MSVALQRAILLTAAERDDGRVVVSEVFDPGAVRAAVEQLVAEGWLRHVSSSEGAQAWKNADGLNVAFEITAVGRAEAVRLSQARQLDEIQSRMKSAKATKSKR